jgi:hypothetical protein
MIVKPYHRKMNKQKPSEIELILDKNLWVIVNNKHRPIYHKDGHLLIFPRKKDAESWLDTALEKVNNTGDSIWTWRIIKLSILISRK